MALFNERQCDNMDYEKMLFEQYKLYVELGDRISQRRAVANGFYVTANATLLTVASWFQEDFGSHIHLVSFIGIILALSWFFSIRSYGQLNTGKFMLIHEIESRLPLNLFSHEWTLLGAGKSFKKYWPLSHVEKIVPWLFIILYIALSVFTFIGTIENGELTAITNTCIRLSIIRR
ncbi:MAG: hypothetical protein FWC71_00525 [Defluviitaleaceae bacterium]|nr:hypothetical protein [Defluviitaleaceae bacterium]